MRTRYGVSPWIHDFPSTRRPDYPKLRGEHASTVVIVGAGLTGCATAYACAMAGMKPVVVDAGPKPAWIVRGQAGWIDRILAEKWETAKPGFRWVGCLLRRR